MTLTNFDNRPSHTEGQVAKAIEPQTARFGVYNKLVEQLGSDRTENAR